MGTIRTKDGYEKQLDDFMNLILIVCPNCAGQAIVKSDGKTPSKETETTIRAVCTKCGYNRSLSDQPDTLLHQSSRKSMKGKIMITGGPIDPYFHFPLWLTTSCCDNLLWAYNFEHLDFLQKHVETKLRERNTVELSNRSIASRLPKWMTSKKNKVLVLKSIANLKAKLPTLS